MSIGFYFPNKLAAEDSESEAVSSSWIPLSVGPSFPLSQPYEYSGQIRMKSGDGTLYVQGKGNKKQAFDLKFKLMSEADVLNYKTFFDTVEQSFKSFEYENGQGVFFIVRIMNPFNFKKDHPGLYSGSIQLETL